MRAEARREARKFQRTFAIGVPACSASAADPFHTVPCTSESETSGGGWKRASAQRAGMVAARNARYAATARRTIVRARMLRAREADVGAHAARLGERLQVRALHLQPLRRRDRRKPFQQRLERGIGRDQAQV